MSRTAWPPRKARMRRATGSTWPSGDDHLRVVAHGDCTRPGERVARRLVGGRELDEPQVRVARRSGLQVVEHEATDARVLDDLRAELLGEHLVARPPRAELLAGLVESLDERREVGVADAARLLGAEARERAAGGAPALLGVELLGREEPPQQVLPSVRCARRLAEHGRGSGVPRQDVGARADQVGRVRRHALDEVGEVGRRLARVVAGGQRQLDAGRGGRGARARRRRGAGRGPARRAPARTA